MKSKDSVDKKLKHREVERLRHHKLQKLINELNEVIPDRKGPRETQCAILTRAVDYIKFCIEEYNRIAACIEVDCYSSQSTLPSSQGRLVIDESDGHSSQPSSQESLMVNDEEPELITCHIDISDNFDENDGKNYPPPLPSSFLSSLPYDPVASGSGACSTSLQNSWDDWSYDDIVQFVPSPSPSPSKSPPHEHFTAPSGYYYKDQMYSHCKSCCCYNDVDYHGTYRRDKSYTPRDRLLSETWTYCD